MQPTEEPVVRCALDRDCMSVMFGLYRSAVCGGELLGGGGWRLKW